MEPIPDFDARLLQLMRAHEQSGGSLRGYGSERCVACVACMFCRDCTACVRCNYCVRCKSSSSCTHCDGCEGCHGCSHCEDCRLCVSSSYLARCQSCTDCTYCYGCVGLVGKDFHILNEPYDRKTYFELVGKMRKAHPSRTGESPGRSSARR